MFIYILKNRAGIWCRWLPPCSLICDGAVQYARDLSGGGVYDGAFGKLLAYRRRYGHKQLHVLCCQIYLGILSYTANQYMNSYLTFIFFTFGKLWVSVILLTKLKFSFCKACNNCHFIINSLEGGYYLTSVYASLSLIQSQPEDVPPNGLTNQARESLKEWSRRRSNETTSQKDNKLHQVRYTGWTKHIYSEFVQVPV